MRVRDREWLDLFFMAMLRLRASRNDTRKPDYLCSMTILDHHKAAGFAEIAIVWPHIACGSTSLGQQIQRHALEAMPDHFVPIAITPPTARF
jgi:hypothetical protein